MENLGRALAAVGYQLAMVRLSEECRQAPSREAMQYMNQLRTLREMSLAGFLLRSMNNDVR